MIMRLLDARRTHGHDEICWETNCLFFFFSGASPAIRTDPAEERRTQIHPRVHKRARALDAFAPCLCVRVLHFCMYMMCPAGLSAPKLQDERVGG